MTMYSKIVTVPNIWVTFSFYIQHAFNEAMYLVEQADEDKDGMVTN